MITVERLAASTMLLTGWRRALLAALAGAVAVLALPPFDFFAAMFVSFPVLVWLLDGAAGNPDRGVLRRVAPAFLVGWWFGFGYFSAGLWWLGGALLIEAETFAWALPLAVFGLPAFLALFHGAAAVAGRLLWSDGWGRLAALALALAIAEWLRGLVLTGFPWNAIGYGAMPVPLAMQSVRLIGVEGVTMLAIFVFSVPALFGTRQGLRPGLALAGFTIGAHLGFGAFVLAEDAPYRENEGPVIRLVQPSIPQVAKWSEEDLETVFQAHLDLTTAPAKDGGDAPEIVIWPETAVPYILTERPSALADIAAALGEEQVLATGAIRVDDSRPGESARYYNSVTVIDTEGEIVSAADKVHLVPFGEYLPLEGVLSEVGLSTIAETYSGFTAARERQTLEIGELSVLPLICYEAIFEIGARDLAARPDMILNVTNDAWFGATPGPYQHFRQAQVRAVEAGLPLVRVANNGLSAVTDSNGRIVSGMGLDHIGFVDTVIPPPTAPNWYISTRDWNFWLLTVAMLIAAGATRWGFPRR